MNGATAELCANTMRSPNSRRITSIGVIHHHLFVMKKERSSPMMPSLLVSPFQECHI